MLAAQTQAVVLPTPAPSPEEAQARQFDSVTKWGDALDGGFQIVPDLLLRWQKALLLTPNDVVVALHLMMAWWKSERPPFPRVSTIANRMGASERTIQRSLKRLRTLGLLERTKVKGKEGKEYQAFDLTPLASRLQRIAATDRLAERRRVLRREAAGVQSQSLPQGQ